MQLPRPTRWITISYLFLLSILFISELFPGVASAQTQPQIDLSGKSVLVLHGFEASMPINVMTDRGLRTRLDSGGIGPQNQFFEYLNLVPDRGPEYRKRLADLLRIRYSHRKVDMIITLYTDALQFLLNEARDLFPDVPILPLNMPGVQLPRTNRRLIRNEISYDMAGTLEIALKLVPGAKRVYVLSGTASTDKKMENQARNDFKKWEGRLEFHYLSDMPLEQMLTAVSSVPADSIILFVAFIADSAGKTYTSREVVQEVSRVAKAPLFGLYDTLLGYGIAGGSLASYERSGSETGDLALKILASKLSPENIPAIVKVPPVPMFDWRQLRRWNLSEAALPEGSIVINREITLWDFKYYIIVAFAFFLFETALVIFLVVQRRRKKAAEKSLRQKTEELDRFFDVNLDLLCIANADGYFLRLNPSWERILGYTREELMAKQFLDFVHPDDLERTRQAVATLASQQKVHSFENRYRNKDGTYRWLQWSASPAGKLIYAAARDITERKRAEGALEDRLRFEQFISDMSARFLSVAPQAANREIEGTLKGIVDFFGVSHCVLMKGFPEEQRAIILHAANADDVPPTPLGGNLYQPFPWTSKMLSQAEVLRVPALDGLPAEAAADKERYRDLGVRSFLIVPIIIEGSSRYAIALSNHREEQVWPEVYIPRLELLGKMIVNKIERNEAEVDLKKSEERSRMLIETMNEGLGVRNENGVWTYVNDQLCWMLGQLPGDIIRHPVTEFLDEANQKVIAEEIEKQRNGNYRPYEITWTGADGRKVTTIVSPKPIFGPEGRLKEVFAVFTDITDRKRMEEILREKEEAAREMAREAFVLANIGRTVSSTLNIDQIYEAFVTEAKKIIPFDRIVINLIDGEKGTAKNVYMSGGEVPDRAVQNVYPLEGSGNAEMVRTKSTFHLQTEDFGEYKDRFPMLLSTFEAGFRSIMNVPLFSKGEVIGGLLLRSRKVNAYTDKEARIAESIGNQIAGAIAIAQSFQEQKQMEDRLRQSDERLRLLIEESAVAIGIMREGVITYVNKKYLEMFGYETGDEIYGKPIVTQWAPESRQEVTDRMRCREQGLPVSPKFEGIGLRKDGSKLNVHVDVTNLELKDGPASIAFFTDITERRQAEEALKESEKRFRQVAENVGDFIWEVDAQGLYRYTSPSVERILGYRPDELIGKKHFYDLFTLEVREELKAAAFKVFAAKESFRALPNPNLNKEGKVVHLETSGAPILDTAGNLVGYRGADTDVTERKRMEEELRRHQEHLEESVRERTEELAAARDQAESANRAKSEFLSNMSHELRTPLNSILGIAQLMERDAGFPDAYRDTLNILSRSGAHLLELINDVLELSKVEAGKMTSTITSFDLHSFLGDMEEMVRLPAVEKGLVLRFEYQPSLPRYIETDVRKLRQILINLLSNAIKYTDKGRVTLRVGFNEGMDTASWAKSSLARLEFQVEDTGIGIAPEDEQRIFEPFVQVNPDRTVRDGTGLGLTLSRVFVEQLGGEIALRSQLGRGSIFNFHLPVKLAEAAAVHTEEVDRKVIRLMPGHPPYRLLVVDDSVENRLVLRRLLEQVGFDVLEAAGGQEAVDLYKSSQPNFIWMDLRMPAMDGEETARRIREAESGRSNEDGKEVHTPIIALTAGVIKDQRPFSHSEVFDGLVYKPFRETEIFDKLEKHLGAQFVYQPSVRSAVDVEEAKDTAASTQVDLSILSTDWLNEFYRALRKGHSPQLLRLIDQIRPEHDDLGGTLAGLVRVHRFDKLIAITEGALKGNSNE